MKIKKLGSIICFIIITLCSVVILNGCDFGDYEPELIEIEQINVTIDKTEVSYGVTINLGYNTVPEYCNAYHGNFLLSSYIEFFVRKNGVDQKIDSRDGKATYKVESTDDLVFWVKCCDHEKHSDTEGDLVSDTKTVTIKNNIISTIDDLKAIANSDKYYILNSDIDLSSEQNWEPIKGFTGTLDGKGHSLTNLSIDSVNNENLGLFSELQGTIKDLKVENAQITAKGDIGKAGIIAGTNKGTISNVTVEGSINVKFYNNVGGIVGYNDCGKIVNCINQATITGANNVGGIVGYMKVNNDETITGCRNDGTITGREDVGGIAGYITCVKSFKTYSVSNNVNNNKVNGTNNVGGIFGEVYAFTTSALAGRTSDTYFSMSVLTNNGEIKGNETGSNVGGLIGKATRLSILTSSENNADITGGYCIGGFVGYAPDTTIKALGAKNNNTITGKGKVGGFAGQTGVIEEAINNGEIKSTGVLIEDDKDRAYIGGIAGYCTGLIGCENHSNIIVDNKGDFVGGLAGYIKVSDDNMDNNINYGIITGFNCIGGIAGYITCVKSFKTYLVTNNSNNNKVNGTNNVGGIFGEVYAFTTSALAGRTSDTYFSMSVLTNNGEIKGNETGSNVGGLIGKATRLSILTSSENKANIIGGDYVGGFVGYAPDTTIKANEFNNNSTITGKTFVGSFAGQAGVVQYAINSGTVIATGKNDKEETYLGGIVGYCNGIISCTNNSDVSLTNGGKYVGGIAGYVLMTKVEEFCNNENYGMITGTDCVGGICGYVTCKDRTLYKIDNNKNSNTVQGNSYVGGIVGYVNANFTVQYFCFEVINNKNESEIIGNSKVGGICGGNKNLKKDENLMSTNTNAYGEKLGE